MNNKKYSGYIIGALLVLVGLFLIITFNSLVKKEEKVKVQWAEVQNAYQRRLDLIPNLVNTVKGNANFEQNILQNIAGARASAINKTTSDIVAKNYNEQLAAQDNLAIAANQLIINVEKYPDLQGTKAFVTLQTQLERTELRIKTARKDFNESIQLYNSSTRSFPTSMVAKLFGFNTKDGFLSVAGADKATEIKFK
ncbi:MAG: LemA family protein [Ferruginibacter sp.]|nr:LemA family protein [Ferruginibacter sp.]